MLGTNRGWWPGDVHQVPVSLYQRSLVENITEHEQSVQFLTAPILLRSTLDMAVSVLLRGLLALSVASHVVLPCAAMMMSGRPEIGFIGYGIPMYDVSVPPSQSSHWFTMLPSCADLNGDD